MATRVRIVPTVAVVTFRCPQGLLKRVEDAASRELISKSAFVRRAVAASLRGRSCSPDAADEGNRDRAEAAA